MITVYFGPDECRAEHEGPFTGGIMGGSFITYVCDKRRGHSYPGLHFDSTMGFGWSESVDAMRLVST